MNVDRERSDRKTNRQADERTRTNDKRQTPDDGRQTDIQRPPPQPIPLPPSRPSPLSSGPVSFLGHISIRLVPCGPHGRFPLPHMWIDKLSQNSESLKHVGERRGIPIGRPEFP
jgi:hypothetical protein